jgi:hypothetical protein
LNNSKASVAPINAMNISVCVSQTSKGYVAFEFKASNRWEGKFNRGLKRIQSELKIPNENLMGVFMGPRELLVDDIAVFTVENFLKRLWDGTLID